MVDVLVVSDFNAESVSRFIAADPTQPIITAESAVYGAVVETLSEERSGSEHTSLFSLDASGRNVSGFCQSHERRVGRGGNRD